MSDTPLTVLVIDDERNLRESLKLYLEGEDFRVLLAPSAEAGKDVLEKERCDVVVVDLKMPGMSGLDFLHWMKESGPAIPLIMMSAHGDIQDAVEAMKGGAADYLVKPFHPEELVVRLRRVVSEARLISRAQVVEAVHRGTAKKANGKEHDEVWLGESPAMKTLRALIDKVAPTDSTVLITGESGTGKEVVARSIHRLSKRSDGPFVPINLGGIPENLLESELFGYEKGAFTGAEGRKVGLFELASGGTLFLDEIGDMPLHLQVKLLRVLQDRKLIRLGGSRPIPIDVRIIAATNKNLEEAVREGRFREDLYYRLAVIRLHIPPLREQKEDIPVLAQRFTERFARELGRYPRRLSAEVLQFLDRYPFPGNVRELENAIERAVILSEGEEIKIEDFSFAGPWQASPPAFSGMGTPAAVGEPPRNPSGLSGFEGRSLQELEREAIRLALLRNGGHREKTAQELGITRRTLLNKIREYGL
ncbi:MAG TPA: sigma-54 dependent transcriptional regulator [Termitinemataceae bacterium]|nr:sigma-54 dependent transcriptional regulator [Termitinemataceae bacterium]HOM22683.1 sigma-54 dependent transcriptional regulator [Termitinemataceae bacterium]HPP99522.1 sigma-54 dependent transcriptional regulator [Termitinemataceae bacterium]